MNEAVLAVVRNLQSPDVSTRARAVEDAGQLLAAEHDRLYAVCLRMVGNPERACELAQDTVALAWSKLPAYDGSASLGTWMYGMARNLCWNANRKRGELLHEDGVVDPADGTLPVLAKLRTKERAQLVRRATATLEPVEQEAIYLRYVENLSQDAITHLLELPGTGARGLLQRCRRKLAREMNRQLEALGHGTSFVEDSYS